VFFFLPLYDDNPIGRTPVVTYALIGLCVPLVFLWQLGQNADAVAYTYGMIPAVLFGSARLPADVAVVPPWATIFTSMFLHAGWLHIGGNMLFLWIFGNNIEDVLGHVRYLLLYLVSGVAAALCQALADPASTVPMLGASGCDRRRARRLSAGLPLRQCARAGVDHHHRAHRHRAGLDHARLVVRRAAVERVVERDRQGAGGVAFWAHVGGFVTGIALLVLLRPHGLGLWRWLRARRAFATAHAARLCGPPHTFHGSVPDSGPRRYRSPGPWG
jgi:membrane associated rhomboid family serine protease